MATFMPGEWDNFPLDEQAVFVGADRKRRLADALRQQTTTPQGQMVGGIYVAPSITQYLATGLKGYQANKLERESTQEVQDAYKKRFQIQKDAAQRYADALRPKQVQVGEQKLPFEANQMDRFGSPMQGQVQATQPVMGNQNPTPNDMFNAQLEYAQALGDPRAMQQAVQGRMQYDIQQQTRQDERQFRSQEAQLQREQRMQEIMLRLQDNQLTREQNAALRRELAQMAASNKQGAQPYYQAIQTPQGVMAFNARTGRMEPVDVGGKSVMGAQYDPSLQGEIAASKEQAKTNVEMATDRSKAVKKSDQLLGAANQAKLLLDKNPTASGVGAAVDAAGRLVGVSPESSQVASQLETLSGWMVANVPRMEGPQSNFDVQNYQIMAGKVGDRTAPIAERKKALDTLIQLQEKYKSLNQDPTSNGATGSFDAPPPGAVRRKP